MKKAIGVSTALAFIFGTLLLIVHVVNSQQPSSEKLKRAFPKDSYDVFMDSRQLILYSLEPEKRIEGKELFHGYSVLGKTDVSNAKLQAELKSSLVKAMAGAYGASCFSPHHGLRVIQDKKTVDVIIRFECGNIVTYYGEAKGEGDVSDTPTRLYNRVLSDAGVGITKN